MSAPIQDTLAERKATHGDFTDNALVAQQIKSVVRNCCREQLSCIQAEALDFIASKIGRICSGNADEVDHWQDIAGYALLVAGRLSEKEAAQ